MYIFCHKHTREHKYTYALLLQLILLIALINFFRQQLSFGWFSTILFSLYFQVVFVFFHLISRFWASFTAMSLERTMYDEIFIHFLIFFYSFTPIWPVLHHFFRWMNYGYIKSLLKTFSVSSLFYVSFFFHVL